MAPRPLPIFLLDSLLTSPPTDPVLQRRGNEQERCCIDEAHRRPRCLPPPAASMRHTAAPVPFAAMGLVVLGLALPPLVAALRHLMASVGAGTSSKSWFRCAHQVFV